MLVILLVMLKPGILLIHWFYSWGKECCVGETGSQLNKIIAKSCEFEEDIDGGLVLKKYVYNVGRATEDFRILLLSHMLWTIALWQNIGVRIQRFRAEVVPLEGTTGLAHDAGGCPAVLLPVLRDWSSNPQIETDKEMSSVLRLIFASSSSN
ncbi:hypothetical protein OUZ56_002567 [Daphnia magna]|uniref:Uncharacterized protein n=1 Tax=Daphnia magna TaxID=35525 RepID=A0ABR0A6H3_9CRUS|nr:hypothetical protein OUZ56_002567 [Daphnia magna]